MDTRTKIVTAADLEKLNLARPLLVATGRFDVLRTEAADALSAARERTGAASLLVALRPLADGLAPIEARAEMTAALRMVDYVFIVANGDWPGSVASLQPIEIVDLEDADAERIRQLIEHVRRPRV